MKNSWRLVNNLLAFVIESCGDKLVFISGVEKKEYSSVVKRMISLYTTDITKVREYYINSQGIEVSFDLSDCSNGIKNREVLKIKSKDLPESDYYILANFDKSLESITNLIKYLKIENGSIVGDCELSIDSSSGLVRVVQNLMPDYVEYKEEFIRRMNCEIYKKTTKWIPGHRYDSLEQTYFYLGQIKSHTALPNNSEFLEGSEMTEWCLVSTSKTGEYKDNIEALVNGFAEGTIKVIQKPILMVDSGKAFEIKESYNTILNAALYYTIMHTKDSNGDYMINNVSDVLQLFNYESPESKYEISDEIKEMLKEYFTNIIDNLIPVCWERPQNDMHRVTASKSLDENAEACFNTLISYSQSSNIKKYSYYKSLFKYLDFDILDLIKERLSIWSPKRVLSDFDLYSKYAGKMVEISTTAIVVLRSKDSSNHDLKEVPLSSFLAGREESDITKIVNTIVDYTRKHSNIYVANYEVNNVGTKSCPKIYEKFKINLNNIINYHKEQELEMPENLKYEIMLNKFYQVIIEVDKDRVII